MSDLVNKPSHYNAGEVETIDAIKSALGDAFLDYCRGNVLKYVWRCRHKGNTLEDLHKAAKYLEWAIKEAESEKPSKTQPLAIPDGWRELELRETPRASDMYEHEETWMKRFDDANCEYEWYDVRHIRKIETPEPEQLAIPEGWRELEENEPLSEDDLFDFEGEWVGHECDPSGGVYNSRIHRRHIRKIETENASEVPNSSQWIPKVGDKVRLRVPVLYPTRDSCNYEGRITEISQSGRFTIFFASEDQRIRGWVKPKDLHLVEAAQ